MKGWLFCWLFTTALLSGCTPGEDAPLAERQARIRSELASRNHSQEEAPLGDLQLARVFPDKLAGYDTPLDRGATFQSKDLAFSEATRTFYGPGNVYLRIRLADYVADTSGFMRIWRNYVQVEQGYVGANTGEALQGAPSRFAWLREEPIRGVAVLEAGVDFRFHLWITVHPAERKGDLLELWQAFREKRMPSDAPRWSAFLSGE